MAATTARKLFGARSRTAHPRDETDLVRRLQRGDEAAFSSLFAAQHGVLLALATTIVRDRAVAEEVVQDTWLAVIAGIGRFEARATLSTWLAGICLNKARTRARRDGRWRPFAELAAREVEAPTFDPESFLPDGHWAEGIAAWDPLDPERIVDGRQLWSLVAGLIDELPEAQRAVLILRDVEGHAAEDACQLLDIPDGRQRILLHRARAQLRERVASAMPGPSAPQIRPA